jgi:ferredoxin
MKIEIDWPACEGNGICSVEAPEVFEIDDDDQLIVLDENPPESLRDKVNAAARACPKRAILVRDEP